MPANVLKSGPFAEVKAKERDASNAQRNPLPMTPGEDCGLRTNAQRVARVACFRFPRMHYHDGPEKGMTND
jgi:hypothetical protein